YKPVIEVLDRGPMTVHELVASPPATKLEWSGLIDAIKVLVGRGDLQPALPAENEAERAVSARAFNAAVTALAKDSEDLGYLASPVTARKSAFMNLMSPANLMKSAEFCRTTWLNLISPPVVTESVD